MSGPGTSQGIVCEWPREHDCSREVVAKIGLPSPKALWVCQPAFTAWQGEKIKLFARLLRGDDA